MSAIAPAKCWQKPRFVCMTNWTSAGWFGAATGGCSS
jgi:hypothetical protein